MESELRPISYGDRPAYLLMWGGLFGFALHWAGWLVGGGVVWGIGLLMHWLLRSRTSALRAPLWIGAWALIFGLYCEVRTPVVEQSDAAVTLYDTDIRIDYPLPVREGNAQRVKAEVAFGDDGEHFTTLLHIPRSEALSDSLLYGATLKGTLDVVPLHLMPSEGYATYLRTRGIEAVGYLQSVSSTVQSARSSFNAHLMKWRESLIRHFDLSVERYIDEKGRALLYALLLGERSRLDRSDKEVFAEAGLSHLLALSGFHLGIIYLVVARVLAWLLPLYRYRKLRYILLLLSLVAYTLFTGAAPSTLRALLMSGLYLGARLLDRRPDGVQILSLTLVILWLINPHSIMSPGLIMSASAVWGILVFFPLLQSLLHTRHPVPKYLYEAFCLTVSAQVGVLPWILFFWGAGSLMPFWSSVPMTMLTAVLIPLGLIALVASLVIPSAWMAPVLYLLDILICLLLDGGNFFAEVDLPEIALTFGLPSVGLYYILCHYVLYQPAVRMLIARQRKDYTLF
ncbi:hypothetical protein HQ35_08635 [Porphyromonas cangingivalis]|uniref:ComEC/Rec2-related protein domain-containing protein n=1 Tax=Porphyromonas cangingivalis TaxID=36874 RepID=A0A0A2ENC9_PORCN|nr:ComEC/Rec2 family competence protein [Porphyromonas cangingivalis]KGN79207.1 hypothetical protein HQ35_08635 [Porphyromonas cangingivalis]